MIGKLSILVLSVFLIFVTTACGSKIAYLGRDGNVHLINPDGSGDTALTSDPETTIYPVPTWSWDGRYLAWGEINKAESTQNPGMGLAISVFDTLNGTTKSFTPPDIKNSLFGFAWRQDKDTLYVGYTTADEVNTCFKKSIKGFRIIELDPSSGVSHLVTTLDDGSSAWLLLPSPDPNLLAFYENDYCEGRGNLCILDLKSSEKRCTNEAIGGANWSPDGKKLIFDTCSYLEEACGITVLDATTLAETIVFPKDSSVSYTGPAWSPAGDLFVYSMAQGPLDAQSLGVWATKTDGSATWKIDDGYFPSDPQAFSPDGLYVTYTKETAGVQFENWIASIDGHFKQRLADGSAPFWQPKRPVPTPSP